MQRLASDTAIYGISTIVGRFLNFLLVPFYTNVLPPNEYGVVAYVFSLIAFFNVIYSYGMESAFFRYASSMEIGTKKQNFSTPFYSLLLTSLFFSLFISFFKFPLANLADISPNNVAIVDYAAWILFFDALAILPFASLRLENKPKIFSSIKILNIASNVIFNIIFIVYWHYGIEGVFMSNLLSSALTFLFLIPVIWKNIIFEFFSDLYRDLLIFGLPYIPAGIATMMVQVVDRPILRALTDDTTVGIYQANYRLGIIMMLVVSMFDYAWRPFFLANAKEKNAKEIFSKVLTYFFLFMSIIFLFTNFFLEDIITLKIGGRNIIHSQYWSGLGIVPIILLGYMCLGVSNNMVAGIYIEKKTKWLPSITFAGATINIIGNFAFIPYLGIYGAAWATFLSYFIMAVILYYRVNKIYPIQYEFNRILKICIAVLITFTSLYVIKFFPYQIFFKIIAILFFALMLYLANFLTTEEKVKIRSLLHF
ncbi:MAG: polysaccharide biosynthesis C-terminal domain-containing protein [Bacteroidota bacterium]